MSRQQNFTKISKQTIEESKQRLDIVDVILQVVLRKRGKDWVSFYPFYQEKTLSSSVVSPTKKMYYWFGFSAGSAERTQP